jgi:formate dehydrogenase iron-sulfur subunit
MADKSFFIDTSKCTACRGCQMACKQWNKLGTEPTVNRGSHQNPPDLSATTYKLVHFSEEEVGGKPVWYFFPEQCRHCLEPGCKETADSMVKEAILKDEATGAVLFTDLTKKLKAKDVITACPYNIPRLDSKSKRLAKCTMCIDRVKNGLLPACVKTCPTGAMSFGDRGEITAKANKRLEQIKAKYPNASLLDADDVRVIYLVLDDRKKYYKFASAETKGISRKTALRKLLKPITTVAAATAVMGGMIQDVNR